MAHLTRDVGDVVRTLRDGGIAAIPTETVYGLGAAATSEAGVARVFAAKRRPASHPLIVHVASFGEFPKWAQSVPRAARELAQRFLPGPLTIVLNKTGAIPGAVTGGRGTVALRVPSHPLAREVLAQLGGPVAAPSANLHGRTSATSADHVLEEFAAVDMPVLDGGSSAIGIESAIVDLSDPDKPRLLRSGSLPRGQISEALGVGVEDLSAATHGHGPGGLARHYSPRKPLSLCDPDAVADRIAQSPACGLVSPSRPPGHAGPWLRAPAAPEEYMRDLYAMLRRLDAENCGEIVVERPPAGAEWDGVRDRLARASAGDP